jgi:hypothetical protein
MRYFRIAAAAPKNGASRPFGESEDSPNGGVNTKLPPMRYFLIAAAARESGAEKRRLKEEI